MLKMHLKKYAIVQYYGINHVINFDHWTTVENYQDGIHNLRVQVAMREFFTNGVGSWPHIALDKDNIEVIEC